MILFPTTKIKKSFLVLNLSFHSRHIFIYYANKAAIFKVFVHYFLENKLLALNRRFRYNEIEEGVGEDMKLETQKHGKLRDRLRTVAWLVIVLQIVAIFWLLTDLGVDKFTAIIYACLLVVFSVIQLVLVIKSSDY